LTGHGGDITSLNNFPFKQLKCRAIRRSCGFTMVAKHQKDFIDKNYKIGKNSENFAVIPMGCDTKKFNSSLYPNNFFKRMGINSLIVLFVGRLAEKKGISYLIEALKDDCLDNIDYKLIIVGEGPLLMQLKEIAKRFNVEGKIIFLGEKSHDELPEIYASADVFCAPSITASDGDKEGFSLVLIEAASSGLPVIVTRRGEDESVINNVTGIAVEEKRSDEITRAIYELLSSDQLRIEYGKNGIEHAKQFDWKIIGGKYSSFINDLLKEQ